MQSQQIHLLRCFDQHETHRRSLHGFRNRFSITAVVLVPLEERFDVLRRDQAHVMAQSGQLAADVMGARAGLHADPAARDIGKAMFELTTGYLPLQSDCAPLIQPNQVECVLAEVDPDRGDGFRRL
jgi:hypothetical protein